MVTAIVTGLDVGIYGTGKEASCRTLDAVVRSEVTFVQRPWALDAS